MVSSKLWLPVNWTSLSSTSCLFLEPFQHLSFISGCEIDRCTVFSSVTGLCVQVLPGPKCPRDVNKRVKELSYVSVFVSQLQYLQMPSATDWSSVKWDALASWWTLAESEPVALLWMMGNAYFLVFWAFLLLSWRLVMISSVFQPLCASQLCWLVKPREWSQSSAGCSQTLWVPLYPITQGGCQPSCFLMDLSHVQEHSPAPVLGSLCPLTSLNHLFGDTELVN